MKIANDNYGGIWSPTVVWALIVVGLLVGHFVFYALL